MFAKVVDWFNLYGERLRARADLVFLPALVYVIFFYIPTGLFFLEEDRVNFLPYFIKVSLDITTLFLSIYFVYLLFSCSRFLQNAVIIASYTLGSFSIYFSINFKKPLTYGLIEGWYHHSKLSLIDVFFTGQSIIIAMISAVIGIFVIRKSHDIVNNDEQQFWITKFFARRSSIHVINAIGIVLGVFWLSPLREGIINSYVPYNLFKYAHHTMSDHYEFNVIQKHDISKIYDFKFNGPDDGLTVVLVLGDSLLGSALEINGDSNYNNNPMLAKIDNLVAFKHNYLPNSTEKLAFSSVMSRHLFFGLDKNVPETSIISVMRHLGFKTLVLSAYPEKKEHKFAGIFSEAEQVLYQGDMIRLLQHSEGGTIHDHEVVEALKLVLDKKKDNFVVIHILGNSWPYYSHYDLDFRVFIPDCNSSVPSNCSQKEIINSYNNSILHTDYVLYNLIKFMADSNSILFFVSDQSNENVVQTPKKRLKKINKANLVKDDSAMFVWFSNGFARSFQDKVYSMTGRSQKMTTVGDVFHSILGCIDVDSDVIEPPFNLCSAEQHFAKDFMYSNLKK